MEEEEDEDDDDALLEFMNKKTKTVFYFRFELFEKIKIIINKDYNKLMEIINYEKKNLI